MVKALGIAILVLALVAAILPGFLSCGHDGKVLTLANGKTVQMKCTWTAVSEMAVGVPLAVVGGMMTFSRRKEGVRDLAILSIILGAFVLMLPTNLIGVCASDAMKCHSIMKPSLQIIGGLVMAAGVGGLILSQTMKEEVA